MKVNKQELRVAVDVDGTLVLYGYEDINPYCAPFKFVDLDYYGIPRRLVVHTAHVELVKSYKARGFHVTVNSNNGWQWAEEVVRKLGLEDYVDEVETKYQKQVDDEDIGKAVGARVYIPFDDYGYKK